MWEWGTGKRSPVTVSFIVKIGIFTVSLQRSDEVLNISSGGFKLTFRWFTYCSSNKSVNPNNLIFNLTPKGWDFTELLFTCSELVAAVLLRSNSELSEQSTVQSIAIWLTASYTHCLRLLPPLTAKTHTYKYKWDDKHTQMFSIYST